MLIENTITLPSGATMFEASGLLLLYHVFYFVIMECVSVGIFGFVGLRE